MQFKGCEKEVLCLLFHRNRQAHGRHSGVIIRLHLLQQDKLQHLQVAGKPRQITAC